MDIAALTPMLLEKARPFSDDRYIFELKMDGYRMLAQAGPGRLKSRNGADATGWFPEIVNALAKVRDGCHVMDGEMCVLDEYGRSDFEQLHARARLRGYRAGAPLAVYCVFDLLVEMGQPITHLPLMERKRRLRRLLAPAPPGILLMTWVDGEHGLQIYQQAAQLRLEGVVAKLKDSPYLPGQRSRAWLKVKRPGATPAQRFDRERHPA